MQTTTSLPPPSSSIATPLSQDLPLTQCQRWLGVDHGQAATLHRVSFSILPTTTSRHDVQRENRTIRRSGSIHMLFIKAGYCSTTTASVVPRAVTVRAMHTESRYPGGVPWLGGLKLCQTAAASYNGCYWRFGNGSCSIHAQRNAPIWRHQAIIRVSKNIDLEILF